MNSYRIGSAAGTPEAIGTPGEPGAAGGPARRDAERNRRRIVDAAMASFRARGLDVPMAVVARRSGIATATLYRRFPTKPFAEAYPDEVARHVAVTELRLEALVDRARSTGRLRDDVGIEGVRVLLDAVDGVAAARTDPWVPAQRVVGHFLRSFARG